MAPFRTLQDFVLYLERAGELRRVRVEVDPELEITEIVTRVVRDQGPALLFERVSGSQFPLAINILGSFRRIEMALGREPSVIGRELIELVDGFNPPSLKMLWNLKGHALRLFLATRPRNVRSGVAGEVVESPDLSTLPTVRCWPGDGGRFITMPLVRTISPVSGRSNLGIYRMHVFNERSTGMHWQLGKGGGFHYSEAEAQGRPLEVAAVLGGDPALLMAAVLPLPESLEEILFSGVLRGSPTPMMPARSLSMRVPANAEFVLEGRVLPGQMAREGPFGDHLGHYSSAAQFPVFELSTVTRRRNPIYPAVVVGKPPQEDRFLGDAAQEFLNPMIKLLRPEIENMWAYYQAGFTNLLVVAVKSRYGKEPMKTALGLFGEGQLSLTKCIILVGPGIDVRNFGDVIGEIRKYFRADEDFLLLPRVPLDTLDFTSYTMHLGSKMVLDATPKGTIHMAIPPPVNVHVSTIPDGVRSWRLVQDTLLVVQVPGPGRDVLDRLANTPELARLKLIVAVSTDVDIEDETSLIFGMFTRFDPARDVTFPEMLLVGASPVYRGPLIIDATHKPGYPDPLVMDEAIVERVNERWDTYGI